MLLRFLIASALLLPFASVAKAAIVKGVLTGHVTALAGSNLAGNDDTAAFASILPFGVGSIVQTEFMYDTDTYQEQFTHNVTGTVRLSIDGHTFFEQAAHLDVTPADGVPTPRTSFILAPRSQLISGLESLFPTGWEIDQALSAPGEGSTAFRAVGLFGSADLPVQGFGLPVGPWSEADFTSTDFWIMTSALEGGSTTWTVPGGGTHTGREQAIFGSYTNLTISVIPEPASSVTALIAAAMVASGMRRYRRAH